MYDQMLVHGDNRKVRTGADVLPEENAAVAIWLLSDGARGVNGQILRVAIPTVSLMTHPSEVHPPASRSAWTVPAVQAAFDEGLGRQLQPLGLVPAGAPQAGED
jgi:hypothetical protein